MDFTTLTICESCKKAQATNVLSQLLLCDQCAYRRRTMPAGGTFSANITFVRHSQSCANVLKETGGIMGLGRAAYDDPELSGRGLAMVRDKARTFTQRLEKDGPVIYGSSILYRAQQTIHHLTGGKKQYIIFPFVGEEGITSDNKPAPPDQLDSKLKSESKIDRKRHHSALFNNVNDAKTPSIQRFIEWLGSNKDLVLQYNQKIGGENPKNPNNLRLVIVSHGLNMQHFAKANGNGYKFNNLDEMEVSAEYRDGKIVKIKIGTRNYLPGSTIPTSCPDTTCRKQVCAKKGGKLTVRNQRARNNKRKTRRKR